MELDERFPGQGFQMDNFLLCQSVRRGQGNNQSVRVNQFFLKFRTAVRRKRARKSQMDPAFVEGRDLLVGVHLEQVEFDVGKFAAVSLDERRQDRGGGCAEKADAQVADLTARRSLRKPRGFVGTTQDFVRLP